MTQEKLHNKKVLIIAPFWGKSDHVGCYRVDRFIRWLNSENIEVILVKAGTNEYVEEKDWGIEICIKDYIGKILKDPSIISGKTNFEFIAKFQNLLRLIFSPFDEYHNWTTRIRNNKLITKYVTGVSLILSSSPPHSSHIAANKIAKKYSIHHVVDLRDGWLDEPLLKSLEKLRSRKLIEGRWEKKILFNSFKIFVTSKIWKNMLSLRLPKIQAKIKVLTNAYPEKVFKGNKIKTSGYNSVLSLLYAGRFTGSRYLRKPEIILKPLYQVLSENEERAKIILLSNLNKKDLDDLEFWLDSFKKIKCSLNIRTQVPRNEMFALINKASGLLLLSPEMASIPAKTFEYIKSSKPIFAVTLKNSAVWELGQEIPQMFLYDYSDKQSDYSPINLFLEACRKGDYNINIPEEYSEEYLSKIFLETIREIAN